VDAEELWERVETNVEWVERRAHEIAAHETDRTRALDAKASQVLAVSAVATSIAASALVPRLGSAPRGAVWLAGFAAVSILVAAGTAVYALIPRAFLAFSADEVEQWPTGDFLTQRARDVQGRILNGWLETIARARTINARKATMVRAALIALALALALTAATAGTITDNGREGSQAGLTD
jgi:dipeptide/tripeptide permease